MDKRLFFFCAGVSSTLLWPWLPAWDAWLPLAILGVVCWRTRPALAGFVLGFVWVLCFSHWQLAWLQLPEVGERSQLITASVADVQPRQDGSSRLIVGLTHLDGQALLPRPRILLNGYGAAAALQKGDSFSAITHLYPPHALANPGTFNSARWMLGQGVTARGYITGTLSHEPAATGLRERLLNRFNQATMALPAQHWLRALAFGERSGLTPADWDMLRVLGVSHLFAISGLHIGLVAALGWLAGRFFGRPGAGLIVALAMALGYAWLAGFGVATQRALLMLVLWLGLLWWGRLWSGRRILLMTMTLLLAAAPWLVLNQGFWLSVLAVAALLLVSGLVGGGLIRLQLGLGIVLLPLLMLMFGGFSWLSVVANLVLIPLFSLLLIPLLLLGVGLLLAGTTVATPVLWLLSGLFAPLMQALHWLAETLSPWLMLSAAQQGLVVLALWSALALLLPGTRRLVLALVWLAALTLWPGPVWQVRVLDVGQGLAVLVTQGGQALLYDTGNRYPSGFNMADGVILPLLARLGIRELDYLVVSHDDMDHSANRDYLATKIPVRHRWGAWPSGMACRAGQQRQWGMLRLEMLWPVTETGHSNNDSCVLRISDGRLSLLLTGDIEQAAERQLVASGVRLGSQLLLSPHHGSRSSSSTAFIAAVAPELVVHTAGFANRWGFPAEEVRSRYRAAGVVQRVTGEQGMIQLVADGAGWRFIRHQRPGPWYHRLATGGIPPEPLE